MATDEWTKIKAIFHEAANLPPVERTAFLDSKCKGDAQLKSKVLALLDTDSGIGDFLERPALSGTPDAGEEDGLVDYAIGPYKLVKPISSGGMGIVYEAIQEKPHRKVAIKVMKEGFASKEALHRFEFESEILARFDHPNIAQVIEAGTHRRQGDSPGIAGAGVPYMVMEYIEDALPVTTYVFEKKPSLRERIELFLQICRAVHHGHQRGVIHRDLKPSNILVNARGQIKVIDFGVARAAGRDSADTLVRTEVGQLIGTVRYMSPEQCKADPNDLDIRSDVYTLGIVFYEMLLEQAPYDMHDTTIVESVRVIQEDPPKRPSSIDRTVRGDLETILLKALEKDREHRYQNVSDFEADINRYLRGEVILAKPARTLVRFGKWVKRNRVLSTALALSFVSLVVFLLYVFAWYNPRIRNERDKATVINQFLIDMIKAPDPSMDGIDVKVVDILDRAAAHAETGFENQPDIKWRLLHTLGRTYTGLGQYASAEAMFNGALEILAELEGEHGRRYLPMQVNIAHTIQEQHRYNEAGALLEKLLPVCEAEFGPKHHITLDLKGSLGTNYFHQRRMNDAASLLEKLIVTWKQESGEDSLKTLRCQSVYARVLRELGKYKEAEKIVLYVLDSYRRKYGGEDVHSLNATENLANLYCKMGRLKEAEDLQRGMWDIQCRVMGEKHPYTQDTLSNLVLTLHAAGKYGDAVELAKKQVDTYAELYGEEHLYYLQIFELYGAMLKLDGRLGEAEAVFRSAVETRLKIQGSDHYDTLSIMQSLASLLKSQKKYKESEKLSRELLTRSRAVLGEDHSSTLTSMNNLANVLTRVGKVEEAEALLRETLEKKLRVYGEEKKETLSTMYNLARTLRTQEKFEEAISLFHKIIETRKLVQGGGQGDSFTMDTKAALGMTLMFMEKYSEAEPLFLEVWQYRKKRAGAERRMTLATQKCLANVIQAQKKYAEAEPYYLVLAEAYTRLEGLDDEDTQDVINALVENYEERGKAEEAAKWKGKLIHSKPGTEEEESQGK